MLKPQYSFGKKDKTFSWSAESAAHRQKTLINLPALVLNGVFSCNNVNWLNIVMYITYGRVFGGDSEHFDIWVISWKLKQFGVNNEQGIYSSYRSIKSCIDKQTKISFNFLHIPKLSCGFNLILEIVKKCITIIKLFVFPLYVYAFAHFSFFSHV